MKFVSYQIYSSEHLSGARLAHQQYTRLERPARSKHSSILQKIVTYDCKKFYNNGPKSQLLKNILFVTLRTFHPEYSVVFTNTLWLILLSEI